MPHSSNIFFSFVSMCIFLCFLVWMVSVWFSRKNSL